MRFALLLLVAALVAVQAKHIHILHLTDVHSWVSGHAHEPAFDANYGDMVSLISRLKAHAAANDEDLFVFNTGDIVDGTGLSDASELHGQFVLPIEQQIPYDAIAIGNHELYKNDTVDMLLDSGFIASWKGGYLNSQTRLLSTGQLLGNSHKVVTGPAGTKILTLGFIYNMDNHCESVNVSTVETALAEPWLAEAISEEANAIVVLAHMGFDDKLVDKIHAAIRALDTQHRPLIILTGHTHVRAHRKFAGDSRALVVESGHYFDTVGLVRIQTTAPIKHLITHEFVDARVRQFEKWAHVEKHQLDTDAGVFLAKEISNARNALELDQVLGCAPQQYLRTDWGNATSLWGLYLDKVIPFGLFANTTESFLLIASTGALRYDVFEGPFVRDDAFTVSPFRDVFHYVENIEGATIKTIMEVLLKDNSRLHTAMRAPVPGVPTYAATADPAAGSKYNLAFNTYDMSTVLHVLANVTAAPAPEVQPLHHDVVDSSLIWEMYAEAHWKC